MILISPEVFEQLSDISSDYEVELSELALCYEEQYG